MLPHHQSNLTRHRTRSGGIIVSSTSRGRHRSYRPIVEVRETAPPVFSLSALLVGGT